MTPQPDADPGDVTIRQLSSRVVYQNTWMQLREGVIQRPDGSEGIYSYVDKPDFALIIPIEQDGFHLIEQYPLPGLAPFVGVPPGTLPHRKDADPAGLARRELAEETGLRARRMRRLGYLHPAKDMSSQACTVFVAEGLEAGQHAREHEEQGMRQRLFTRADLENMIRAGTITDTATIAAYLLYLFSGRNGVSRE